MKSISEPKDFYLLYRGIKSLLKCDEAETVRGIADYVLSQYRVLRVGANFVERRRETSAPLIAAYLGAVTRFLEVQTVEKKDGIVWIARLENERRAIEKFLEQMTDIEQTEIILRRPPKLAAIAKIPNRIFPLRKRIFKLVRRLLNRRYEFFSVLRVAEMIGYYAALLEVFENSDFKLAVVSSHSNPHGIAFNLAANRCKTPTMLVTHGMPVKPVARLEYDLAVVHCEAARQIYESEGCNFNRIFVHGRKQNFLPMPEKLPNENLTAGIFLCKDINETRLITLIEQLLQELPINEILIRPHPKNLFVKFDEWLATLDSPRIKRRLDSSVSEDLSKSDIVFGGNSSVLIEAVTAGRPAVYVRGLDYGSEDLHNFVAEKLVFAYEEDLNLEELISFYKRVDWLNKLRKFADIDRDERTVNAKLAASARHFFIKQPDKFKPI